MKYNIIQSTDKPNSDTFDVIKGEVSPAGYPIGDYVLLLAGLTRDSALAEVRLLNSQALADSYRELLEKKQEENRKFFESFLKETTNTLLNGVHIIDEDGKTVFLQTKKQDELVESLKLEVASLKVYKDIRDRLSKNRDIVFHKMKSQRNELVEALAQIVEGAVVHSRQEYRITAWAMRLAMAALKKVKS